MEINLNLLFLVAIVVFILYEYSNQNKTTENFADTTTAVTSDQVKQMIREIYLADIDAIRNLSNVATQLSTGGYTIPATLTVSGKTNLNDITTIKNGLLITNGNKGIDLYPSAGTEQNKIFMDFNSVDSIKNDRDCRITMEGGNTTTPATGQDGNERGKYSINTGDIVINTKGTNLANNTYGSGTISLNGNTSIPQTLNIGSATTDSILNIGGWKIQSLATDKTLRFFYNGQQQLAVHNTDAGMPWKNSLWSAGPFISNSVYAIRYIDISNGFHDWAIPELRAIDIDGNNVASGKPATLLSGQTYATNQGLVSAITNNVIFPGSTIADNWPQGFTAKNGTSCKIRIDLGADYYLKKIVILGRYHDCCHDRLRDANIVCVDSLGVARYSVILGSWTSPVNHYVKEINFGPTVPVTVPATYATTSTWNSLYPATTYTS